MPIPRIAVTMGDPAGIGPELCLRVLNDPSLLRKCQPVVFGDAGVLSRVAESCGLRMPGVALASLKIPADFDKVEEPLLIDCGAIEASAVVPGKVDAACGRAAYAYISAAIDAAIRREVVAVATAPINKEALHKGGFQYPGHTEIFAERDGSKRWCMMQTSEPITVSFVTTHIGYSEVARHLSPERVLDVIELTAEAMERIRGCRPRLLVCGLNPHSGESGLFGAGEEEQIIAPAVREAQRKGIDVQGPLPPDTVFVPARLRQCDAVVCMYHDQGHIPLKMIAFDEAVNTTLGLDIIRTSVDHGTAFDIAWQGKANPGSLIQAILLGCKLGNVAWASSPCKNADKANNATERCQESQSGCEEKQHEQDAHATMKHEQDAHGTFQFDNLGIRQGANLPHWTSERAIYGVTFRLADSLPRNVLDTWIAEREKILKDSIQMKRPLSPTERQRLQSLHSERVEKYLDAGHGACWMKRPEVARLISEAILHFETKRYRLLAWCVMPNHVHVILDPLEGFKLETILHSWKSFTSNKINRLLHRSDDFWQQESYDHIIRDEIDLIYQIRYVLNNPYRAGLKNWEWVGCID